MNGNLQWPERCKRPMSIHFKLQYFLRSIIWQLCSVHALLIQVLQRWNRWQNPVLPVTFRLYTQPDYYHCVSPLSVTAGSVYMIVEVPNNYFFLPTKPIWVHVLFLGFLGLMLRSLFLPRSSLQSLQPIPILAGMSKGKRKLGKIWSVNMSSDHFWRHKCCSRKATIKADWKVNHHKGIHD